MEWLVVVHVLSAVLGLGPAFAFPVMLRKALTVEDMKNNLRMVASLEVFPKLFGTLAIVSGLTLFFVGSYGAFMQLWIFGTLAVYVVIEILVVAFLNRIAAKLQKMLADSSVEAVARPSGELTRMYVQVRNLHLWAGALGIVIFVLMIVKP
ncbi:DUF2269 family protein [Cohnella suwonensis]|uniref:DUF2269 family protein n=1 Tax=Cohnella suwonensis TaxID=696072 RepID=A0ABW0LWE7_9BACL